MPQRMEPHRPDISEPGDLPTWTNILLTDDMPIRWVAEAGEPHPGDELTGRLVIGQEEQLIIDLCGTAVTNLLTVLARVHHDANIPLPLRVQDSWHDRRTEQPAREPA